MFSISISFSNIDKKYENSLNDARIALETNFL